MTISFYYLSGSPFSWKVWLALEHKRLAYNLHVLSADAGDLKSPAYLAINPRGKAPAIVDGSFRLAESAAIVEYLEEAYPDAGASLWPADVQARAVARRIAGEADGYVYPHVRALVVELLMRRDGTPDRSVVDNAKAALAVELASLERSIIGPFAAGTMPSAADFALYPLIAILGRIDARHPVHGIAAVAPPGMRTWMTAVQSLPYFAKTLPPHWRTP